MVIQSYAVDKKEMQCYVGTYHTVHTYPPAQGISEFNPLFSTVTFECCGSEQQLVKPTIASGHSNLVSELIDTGGDVNHKYSDTVSLLSLTV